MMKKTSFVGIIGIIIAITFILVACGHDYSGEYVGYAWKDEAKGVALQDATEKIETKITLDARGKITAVEMNFLVLKNDEWIKRNNPDADISFDTAIEPKAATLGKGDDFKQGESMFSIKANDTMSLYVVGVDQKGTVAFGIVDPMLRFLLEAKFPADYDFTTTIAELTINNGFVPTIRASSGGYLKPETWSEVEGKSILDLNIYSHVYSLRGVFKGINNQTTVRELLELSGVSFSNDKPLPMPSRYGYHSNGGWNGNYERIALSLIGQNARNLKGLVEYTGKSYSGNDYAISINEDNFFGLNADVISGATASIQNSYNTISGATVRVSRENTSFQRALVAAGIMKEDDVIKGRF